MCLSFQVSADDTSLNTVDVKKTEATSIETKPNANSASVQITGISTGIDSPSSNGDGNFKPQRAGTMFARFIDDIFNVSI